MRLKALTSAWTLGLLTLAGAPACTYNACPSTAQAAPLGLSADFDLKLPSNVPLDGAAITVLVNGALYQRNANLAPDIGGDRGLVCTTPNWPFERTPDWRCFVVSGERRMIFTLMRLDEKTSLQYTLEIVMTPVGSAPVVLYKGVATGTYTKRAVHDACEDGIDLQWSFKETLTSS